MPQRTARSTLFAQVLDPANRPDPYPLYARLREEPVCRQDDGTYVVSGHAEIAALLHDPRISSDERKSAAGAGALAASGRLAPDRAESEPALIFRDPPDHDRLRRAVMAHFTPGRIDGMTGEIRRLVAGLLDARRDDDRLDVVDDLAYPLPVAVICALLGVPPEDEPRFRGWAAALARSLDPAEGMSPEEVHNAVRAVREVGEYMEALARTRAADPRDDLLSGLVAARDERERLSGRDLLNTMILLLVAGHETTVNLVTNGTLALLRHPDALRRLRREPELVITLVEEVLRYDPPVQFRTRTTLADVDIAGVTIPRAASVVLLLASGSRDPARFPNADGLVPERRDNPHFGFGGGIHYCIGAPLARIEAQIALTEIAQRLVDPRLVDDPPPYRDNAALRGPAHLPVGIAGVRDALPREMPGPRRHHRPR